jgi:hypothetical protein
MIMQKLPRIGLVCLMAGVGACAWVKPTAQGEQVRVLTPQDVEECTETGSTQVSVLDKLGKLRRSEGRVAVELETLARNSASHLGGNVVVPVSEIVEGVQTFAVYRCDPAAIRD